MKAANNIVAAAVRDLARLLEVAEDAFDLLQGLHRGDGGVRAEAGNIEGVERLEDHAVAKVHVLARAPWRVEGRAVGEGASHRGVGSEVTRANAGAGLERRVEHDDIRFSAVNLTNLQGVPASAPPQNTEKRTQPAVKTTTTRT